VDLNQVDDSDSSTDPESEGDERGPLADFKVFSRRRPQNDLLELVDIEALRIRDLDRIYD
jgi:hypothetical protein